MGDDDTLEKLFVELRETLVLQQPGFALLAVGLVFTLLAKLEAVMVGGNSAESAYPLAVRDAIAVMREAYATSFDAQKVASAVGMSSAQLRTLFKRWVGESPL